MRKGKMLGKIFGIALVLVVIGSMLGGAPSATGVALVDGTSSIALDVPHFSQCDGRWESEPYAYMDATKYYTYDGYTAKGTICNWGCALTCVAMVLNYYDYFLGDTNPYDLNQWLVENDGYTAVNDVNWSSVEQYSNAEERGIDYVGKVWSRGNGANAAEVSVIGDEINSGHPLIVSVGDHYVVITGMEGDTFYINDPYYPEKTTLSSYSNTIYSARVYHGTPQSPIYGDEEWANPPQLVEPGAIIEITPRWSDTLTPTFQWDEVPEADYYGLYIKDLLKDEIVFNSEIDYGRIYGNKVNHHLSFELPDEYKLDYSIYRWNMASHSSAGWSYERNDGGEKYSDRLYFTTYVKGTDVSEYQGQIDWDKVPDEYKFAFCRATIGETEDDEFARNVEQANKKMLVGVYHAAQPDNLEKDATVDEVKGDAKAEAEYFLSIAQKYIKPGYLRPILDVERIGELNEAQLTTWVDEWIRIVKNKSGVEPILYTSPSFANENLADSVSKYDLWIAHFVCSGGATCPPDPVTWNGRPKLAETPWKDKDWSFWQYADIQNKYNTNKIHILGIELWNRVDLDVFNGNISELEKKFVITPAEEQPKPVSASDIVLVMDISGSMDWTWKGEGKLTSAKEAAKALIGSISSGSRVAVTTFADTAQTSVGLTSDFSVTRAGIEELHADGDTNIGDALTKALDELETASETGARKAIVFFTDGHITTGLDEDEVLAGPVNEAVDRQIAIHAIGYGDPSYLHDEFLKKMADNTGGKYYPATKAFQLQNVFIEAGQTAEGWEIEATFTGSVKHQETVIAGEFDLASRPESLKVILNWPGSDLDLKIFDPRGRELDYLAPTITYSGDVKPEYVVIERPFPGTWTAKVHGKTVVSPTEYCLWIATHTGAHTSSSFTQFIPLVVSVVLLFFIVGYFARRSIGKKV